MGAKGKRYKEWAWMPFLFILLASGLHGSAARAQEDPYNPTREKAGAVMLNVRGGPVFGAVNTGKDLRFLGSLGLDFGVAVSRDRNAYLTLTPSVLFKPDFYTVMVPLGFQYDIRLARGLYLYPRASLGYAAMISTASLELGSFELSAREVRHGGIAVPELGLKFVPSPRVNIGIEPFSMPIFFDRENHLAWYRLNVYVGVNL
jgi:hypothetical protein